MILKNRNEIAERLGKWFKNMTGRKLAMLIRHGAKVNSPNPKAELSAEGEAQVAAYAEAIRPVLNLNILTKGLEFSSSSPDRNLQTLSGLFGGIPRHWIAIPVSLDLLNLGPQGQDYVAAQALAKEHPDLYANANEACSHLEQHGLTRFGEHPDAAVVRVRAGIIERLELIATSQVAVISINSPTGNRAVGVDGVLKELEILVVSYDEESDTFAVLDRITPEFADEPASTS